MSRRTIERRRAARELWPHLGGLLGYFHEDFPEEYGSVEGALEQAATELPLDSRKAIVREWYDWQAKAGRTNDDLRRFVQEGFGVRVYFKKPIDARSFMNLVHDRMIQSVRRDLGADWKP